MSCPTENQLAEYLEGLLSKRDRDEIDGHLDACGVCFSLVAASLSEGEDNASEGHGTTLSLQGRRAAGPDAGAERTRPPEGVAVGAPIPSQLLLDGENSDLHMRGGRYSIRGDQGHGGQAWVFTVFDEYMRREVALKSLLPAEADGEASLTKGERERRQEIEGRFLREARILAQLNHPSIIHVHEVGRRNDGTLYYTMPLVRGQTLAAALQGAQTLSERLVFLRHFADLCNGIAYAHSRGVLHRDIKPSNVMIGEFGETLILDWGLGIWKDCPERQDAFSPYLEGCEQPDRTADGVLLGTPSYMSPEHASGVPEEIDERSDVWSLGAVLYEILTGRPPHRSRTASRLLKKARTSPVRPVAERCGGVPPDLAAVAEKALELDRQDRYPSARALADDVAAFMTGQRVSAYGYSRRERVLRFVAAHKAAVAALAAILTMLVVVIVLVGASYRRERAAHQLEASARQNEAAASLLAQYHLAEAYATKARQYLAEGDALGASVFAAGSLNSNPAHPLAPNHQPGFADEHPESRYLAAQALADLMRSDTRAIRGLVAVLQVGVPLHRLGVAGADSRLVAASSNRGLWLWEWPSRRMIIPERAMQESYGLVGAAPKSPDFVVASGNLLRLREARAGAIVRQIARASAPFTAVAISGDGAVVAGGNRDHVLRTWSTATGELLTEQDVGQDIQALAFGGDGERLALGMPDGRILLRRKRGGALETFDSDHKEGITSLAFSPDARSLASGSHDRSVRLRPLDGPDSGKVLGSHQDSISAVVFTADGKWLTSTGRDGVLHIWDAATGALVESMGAQHLAQGDAQFLGGGDTLVTCGSDGNVRLWEIDRSKPPPSLSGHTGYVHAVQFSHDGSLAISGGMDGLVRIWDAKERKLLRTCTGHTNAVRRVAMTKDNRFALSAGRDRSVRMWDVRTGQQVGMIAEIRSSVFAMALSPDEAHVALSLDDGAIGIASLKELRVVRQWKANEAHTFGLAWSPDGKHIASGGGDGRVTISDAASGGVLQRYLTHDDWVGDVAYSPDGGLLASAGKDAKVVVRELSSGRCLCELHDHSEWVNRVAFSKDGRLLASAGDDGLVIVRETRAWRPVLQISTKGMALGLDFSSDGKLLAISSRDDIALWDLDWSRWNTTPTTLLREAERAADVVLRGFRLNAATNP